MTAKAQIIERVFNIDEIINEAQPFDIIVFNNDIYKQGRFSFTSFLVKFGSFSGWNHAALIMDDKPTKKNKRCPKAPLPSCKCRRKHQGRCKYVYEYAASREPVTYKTLEEKLESEKFNSISLIRFKRFNAKINKFRSYNASSKKLVIQDFLLRMGCSAQAWKDRDTNNKLKNLSYKYTYNTTNIIHRTLLTLAVLICAAVYISTPLSFLSQVASEFLFWSLVCLFFVFPAIKIMECFNIKRYKEVIARRAICSGYPPAILCSIMFNPKTEKRKIRFFDYKWTQVTPPSPANLYKNAKSSKSCIVFKYKK